MVRTEGGYIGYSDVDGQIYLPGSPSIQKFSTVLIYFGPLGRSIEKDITMYPQGPNLHLFNCFSA